MQSHLLEGTAPDLLAVVRGNTFFRRVVATGEHEQVVVMTLEPGENIGSEVHEDTDQVFLVVEGSGVAEVGPERRAFDEGDIIFVRAGSRHDVINHGHEPLRVITIYAPPAHLPGTFHRTKADAQAREHQPDPAVDDHDFLIELV